MSKCCKGSSISSSCCCVVGKVVSRISCSISVIKVVVEAIIIMKHFYKAPFSQEKQTNKSKKDSTCFNISRGSIGVSISRPIKIWMMILLNCVNIN